MKDKKFNTINELLSFVGKSTRGTLYNGLCEEAMPKRGTFFRLQIYETREGNLIPRAFPLKNGLIDHRNSYITVDMII